MSIYLKCGEFIYYGPRGCACTRRAKRSKIMDDIQKEIEANKDQIEQWIKDNSDLVDKFKENSMKTLEDLEEKVMDDKSLIELAMENLVAALEECGLAGIRYDDFKGYNINISMNEKDDKVH